MTVSSLPDVIDQLVGIQPGDALDAIRAQRQQARLHAQQSHIALFEPADLAGSTFTAAERHALAVFVAGLHGQVELGAFHASALLLAGAPTALFDAVSAEAEAGAGRGPYGSYPVGPLSAENAPGPLYAASAARRAVLGTRLAAALAHAHRLVFHPRDAEAAWLQALLDAGWSTTEIVTLSQLVSFLSFQIRVIAGLRALAAQASLAIA
ncbi:CMD domain protein [Variovorax sp. UMC13]|uniref:CMD domain protein n=1 Tax=Variovorax sp. UMC13 TaxID=1862326 RepID=UPI0016035FE8|nr:CMD domain protein [Variovorax sp. UMC13]MBB1602824.1 CMD domain protein [Variovorax sp. UMC13]